MQKSILLNAGIHYGSLVYYANDGHAPKPFTCCQFVDRTLDLRDDSLPPAKVLLTVSTVVMPCSFLLVLHKEPLGLFDCTITTVTVAGMRRATMYYTASEWLADFIPENKVYDVNLFYTLEVQK